MKVIAFDLGLNVGWALLEDGKRPLAGSFTIPHGAHNLGGIAIYFEQRVSVLLGEHRPDVVARAARFTNRYSNAVAIGPYFGLSMVLDAMAQKRLMRDVEVAESAARKSFLGKIPRKSKAIKKSVIAGCIERGWPAKDDHCCDAQVIAAHVLAILSPKSAHETTPLFQNAPPARARRRSRVKPK